MNVYITFDRYESNEWFSVYRIETNKKRAMKLFKKEDLPSFLGYGPDDCHSFQLMKLQMTKEDYKRLCDLVKIETDCEASPEIELKEMLIGIYNENDERFCDFETLYSTDGCSDNFEVIDFYMANYDYEVLEGEDEHDVRDRISEMIYNDDILYNKVIREYIKANY